MAKSIPAYLLTKKNIIFLLIFIMVFSLIFINIYRPFNSTTWMENGTNKTHYFLRSGLIVMCGMGVLIISRTTMYLLRNIIRINHFVYFSWVVTDIVVMSVIYSVVGKYSFHDARDLLDVFPRAVIYISLILVFPYTVSWLYLTLQEKNRVIAKIIEMKNVINDGRFSHQQDIYNLIHFHDDSGTLRLSIKFENLFYIESADNYVNIYYENKGKIVRFLVRKSLKSMEKNYKEYPLIRTHRSYIVNAQKIKVFKKGKDGVSLDLGRDDLPDIPVSKTYSESVVNMFYK